MSLLNTFRTISVQIARKPTPQLLIQNQVLHQKLCRIHTSGQRRNAHIINIQDTDDFSDRVLKNAKPVVVDFHATWCGPCKLLGPRLESLVASKDGRVVMAKVDIDEHSDLALDHGVEAVPTVLAVKGGRVVDRFVGLKDDTELKSFLNKLTGE